MGAPFEGSWDAVKDAAYYVGAGGGESIWLFISIALCVLACIMGYSHEAKANRH